MQRQTQVTSLVSGYFMHLMQKIHTNFNLHSSYQPHQQGKAVPMEN